MSVYVVVDNEVHQPEEYAKYLELITPTVAEYGGIRYSSRGDFVS